MGAVGPTDRVNWTWDRDVASLRGTAALLGLGNRGTLQAFAAMLFGGLALVATAESGVPDIVSLPESGIVSDLKQRALFRPDPAGELSPDQLLSSDEGFRSYDPAWEESAPPMWIKIPIHEPAGHEGNYRLLIKSRFFPRLDLFLPTSGPEHRRVHSGTSNYEPTEKLGHNYFYEFDMPPGSSSTILIYAEVAQGSLSALDLTIVDESTFQQYRSANYWAFGLYFGAMLALIFYNLILYLNLRTPGHRLYVTAMTCVIVLMGMNSGLLQNVLPDLLVQRGPMAQILFNALTAAATARFAQVFINTRNYVPVLHHLISVVILMNLIAAAPTALLPVTYAPQMAVIVQPIGTLTLLLLLAGGITAGLRGSSSGYVFFAAWAAFVIGAFTWTLLTFDAIERTPATEYSLYIGSVMEAMILALGLSYRVGQLRTQRNRAIREQQRAARLANIDSLTGAFNRRFIENYLDGLLDSEDRRAFQGSLIMLDMDNFKPVNDEFGHAAGDAVLQEMANRCQEILRAEDVLARLGGDEFAIVLPNESGDEARAIAERIRNSIADKPAAYGMQLIPMSVSIGVVTSFEPGATAYSAFKHADRALYKAKRAGRNRVVVLTGGEELPAQVDVAR